MFHCKRWRGLDHPSVTVFSRKVSGMLAQIDGIFPRKLLINKSKELSLTNCRSKKCHLQHDERNKGTVQM